MADAGGHCTTQSHRHQLYNNPETGQLVWISWDHNLVLGSAPGSRSTTLDVPDIGGSWPLIRFLLDNPTSKSQYIDYLEEAATRVFKPDDLTTEYQELAKVITPYAANEGAAVEFEKAARLLIERINERAQATAEFLSTLERGQQCAAV